MTDATYSNVLVPTDGSDLAERALEEALRIAGLTDATIHVLFVVDDAKIAELASECGTDTVTFDADVDSLFERFVATGTHALEDLRDAAAEHGVAVTAGIRKGLPRDEILAYAEENGNDLIVMGTHGRRGLERYVLGSTTESVLRRSPVPVLVVRRGANDD
ncbi:MAG: universal stress protein [Haloarculaceae archaeon]